MLFRYKAIKVKTGQQKKGKIVAGSREQAIEKLRGEGWYPSVLIEAKPSIWTKDLDIWLGKPVKKDEFVAFCRQLATLLRAGITIMESIRLLADQAKSKLFKAALDQIYLDVRSGSNLSDACQEYPRIFDKVFVNMIRSGELSGDIDMVMERLAVFFEKEYDTREKVKSALSYPMVVSVVAFFVILFLLTNIVPKLVSNLVSSGGNIPLPTAIVLGVSNVLIGYWYLLITGFVLLIVGYKSIQTHSRGRYYIDYVKLKLPVFGVLIQKSTIARMSRTLSSLFASAVPVLQSLTMVSEIVNNEVFANILRDSRESLRGGDRLSEPFEKSWVFPKLVTHMIAVGEETGQMDTMLGKIADFYEADVDHMATRLSKIIEPLMIVLLSIIVGTILLATLLPMLEIYQHV